MIKRVVHVMAFCILATQSLAQTVAVRSGEHENFTRLVFDLPARVPWTIEENGREATLHLDRKSLRLDAGAVFERVPRGRLDSARADGASLALGLGCDCDVTAFWHGKSLLVVDIIGIAEDIQAEEDAVFADAAGVEPGLPDIDVSARPGSLSARLVADAMALPQNRRQQAPEMHFEPERTPVAAWQDVQITRDVLVRQFGRAASQGLLSPRKAWQPNAARSDATDPVSQVEEELDEPVEDALHTAINNMNLRAESSIDRDFGDRMAAQIGLSSASGCVAARQVDVLSWDDGSGLAQQVGPLRARLTGEFDKIDEAAAMSLARLYLHFGFGQEAAQVLNLLANPSAENRILLEMAEILEAGFSQTGHSLKGQLQCQSGVALWSALSYRNLPDDVPIDSNAILRAFGALPPHLRAFLGPVLSRRFLAAGRADESEKIQRTLNRNDTTMTADSRLADAEIAFAEAPDIPADAVLSEVVASNALPAAEALLKMIERRLARGADISYEQAQLLGAYAFENKDQPISTDLARAHVAALAASGAFNEAYFNLTTFRAEYPAEGIDARGTFLRFLTEKADDMVFLKHVLSGHGGDPEELGAEIANAVAARLLSVGFHGAARGFVKPSTTGPQNRARKLLRAKIALREGRPRQAEVDLLGITGRDANLLRAQARSMVGEYAAAHDLYLSSERPNEAVKQAWLANEPARVGDVEAPGMSLLAGLDATEGQGAATVPTGTLARNRLLLDESDAIREAIEDLLTANPAPDVSD